MRGRPVAAWPIPSISGAHAHYAYNSIPRMRTHVYTYRMPAPRVYSVFIAGYEFESSYSLNTNSYSDHAEPSK